MTKEFLQRVGSKLDNKTIQLVNKEAHDFLNDKKKALNEKYLWTLLVSRYLNDLFFQEFQEYADYHKLNVTLQKGEEESDETKQNEVEQETTEQKEQESSTFEPIL